MKRMKLRVGDPVLVRRIRSVVGCVVATKARSPMGKNEHEPNVTVETIDGERAEVCEEDVVAPDIITAVAALEAAPDPVSIKIEGRLTLNGQGIHVHSRMFVGKPGCTRACVNSDGFTMRKPEWLAFVSVLKLGAMLSEGKVEVEVPHESQTDADGPTHARCLTCGGRWPECGQ